MPPYLFLIVSYGIECRGTLGKCYCNNISHNSCHFPNSRIVVTQTFHNKPSNFIDLIFSHIHMHRNRMNPKCRIIFMVCRTPFITLIVNPNFWRSSAGIFPLSTAFSVLKHSISKVLSKQPKIVLPCFSCKCDSTPFIILVKKNKGLQISCSTNMWIQAIGLQTWIASFFSAWW